MSADDEDDSVCMYRSVADTEDESEVYWTPAATAHAPLGLSRRSVPSREDPHKVRTVMTGAASLGSRHRDAQTAPRRR